MDERANLLNIQETCAQLSLLGIVSGMKKERIDPDGRGSGHDPITVRFLFYRVDAMLITLYT